MNPNIHIMHAYLQATEHMHLYPACATQQAGACIKMWLLTTTRSSVSGSQYPVPSYLMVLLLEKVVTLAVFISSSFASSCAHNSLPSAFDRVSLEM